MKTSACKRRVAVTGIGVVSPNGLGLSQFWNATRKGMSGIDTISRFDAHKLPCRIADEVKDFCAEQYFAPNDIKRVGRGSTCDAHHRVRLDPCGEEPARAMELAIQDAGVAKDEIGYMALHGTSTLLNDKVETIAAKLCFGRRANDIPMSSIKSMIGHPQGASGAAGVVAAILAMRHSYLPPRINYEDSDPECDLNYIPNRGIGRSVEIAL